MSPACCKVATLVTLLHRCSNETHGSVPLAPPRLSTAPRNLRAGFCSHRARPPPFLPRRNPGTLQELVLTHWTVVVAGDGGARVGQGPQAATSPGCRTSLLASASTCTRGAGVGVAESTVLGLGQQLLSLLGAEGGDGA